MELSYSSTAVNLILLICFVSDVDVLQQVSYMATIHCVILIIFLHYDCKKYAGISQLAVSSGKMHCKRHFADILLQSYQIPITFHHQSHLHVVDYLPYA